MPRPWTRWSGAGTRTARRPGCWPRAVHWVGPAPGHRASTRPRCSGPAPAAEALGHGLVPAGEVPLAGPGTPGVAQYAVEELAAALDLSLAAGLHLVSEAVELCFRLPRLWALVHDGRLQAWKASQVARATTGLSPRVGRPSWTGTSR